MIPQAIEIEESVLGACLLDPDAREIVFERLDVDCFYTDKNKSVFKSIQKHNGDFLAVEDETGISVSELMNTQTVDPEYHCGILLEKKMHRQALGLCRDVLNSDGDAYTLIDKINRGLNNIDKGVGGRESLTPSEIRERDKDKPIAEKLHLGLSDLDFGIYSDGNRRGQVEVTIADSGHGKTKYAEFKCKLLESKYNIAWFQLEGYDSDTAECFETDNVYICHSLYDIEEIKREARILNREVGIDYIVFDYVQNIECNQNISKTERLEYISQQITRMAKDFNCVCHVLSQVTISYNTRGGWKQEPTYGDVRWSQQLKQDAHIITSIFRPSKVESLVVNEKKVKDWNDNLIPYNSVFVKQAKVRHGVQEWKRLHMLHHEDGLKPYTKTSEELLYG